MSVDSADVAAVRALEPQVRALREAIEAALPAVGRLSAADYPGAEWAADQLNQALRDGADGTPVQVLTALEIFRTANGSMAVADFEFYSKTLNLSPDEAVREMVRNVGSDPESLDRIKAMRQYAASVA